jgi:hypothetical protein
MKLITFLKNGKETLGWAQQDQATVLVIDQTLPHLPSTMLDVVEGGDAALRSAADQLPRLPLAGTDFPTIFLRLARNQIADAQPMIAPDCSDMLD